MYDMIEDEALLTVVKARMESNTGETRSFEDVLAKDGITLADIDAMEDVEIE